MPEIGVSFYDNRNSMLYWYPKLTGTDIPMPETEFFIIGENDTSKLSIEHDPEALLEVLKNIPTQEIKRKVNELPTEKAHIRSDYKASRLMGGEGREITTDPKQIDQEVLQLLDSMLMLNMPHRAIAVREWLNLETFGRSYNTHICSEVRFIVDEGEVLGGFVDVHEDDFDNSFSEDEIETILSELNSRFEDDKSKLSAWAETAGKQLGDSWSIDFIQDVEGDWYLTDMALYGLWYDAEEEKWKNISHIPDDKPYNLEENPPNDLPDEPTENMISVDRKR